MNKLLSVIALSLSAVVSAQAAVVVIGAPGAADISASDAKKMFLGKGSSSAVVYELDEGNATRSEFHSKVTKNQMPNLKRSGLNRYLPVKVTHLQRSIVPLR